MLRFQLLQANKMDLVKLNTIFDIEYGNQFDLSKMILTNHRDGINFISRSSKNFGISGKVEENMVVEPYDAGLITVTLGGTYLLTSFIQPDKFYTAQNIKVLKPKENLTFNQKLFYCICINHNRFKYSSHGREANVSLDTLLVPREMPNTFEKIKLNNIISEFEKPILKKNHIKLETKLWKEFRFDFLFDIKKGRRILNRDMIPGLTPCIRATGQNNGVTAFISHEPNHEGNTITVSYNGSIGEAFYQEKPHFSLDDVNVLYPLFPLNKYIAFFLCTLIRKEKFRFNYGRKWHLERMNETIIKLPVKIDNLPDWDYMENFIKTLPFSKSI